MKLIRFTSSSFFASSLYSSMNSCILLRQAFFFCPTQSLNINLLSDVLIQKNFRYHLFRVVVHYIAFEMASFHSLQESVYVYSNNCTKVENRNPRMTYYLLIITSRPLCDCKFVYIFVGKLVRFHLAASINNLNKDLVHTFR